MQDEQQKSYLVKVTFKSFNIREAQLEKGPWRLNTLVEEFLTFISS